MTYHDTRLAMSALLDRPAVKRLSDALAAAGSSARIIELAETARTAANAAASLGVAQGAIVKSLVFAVEGKAIMALVAGDRRCDTQALGRALGIAGKIGRADADLVRAATGYSIGGVAPLGHATPLPLVIDSSLRRFATVYAAAGHPHCVFATCVDELASLTGGAVVEDIAVEG
jgi:prolyl-tRNA editing enzyme YbaK/EbsC (Cys-tRNA(Pro) deacylase)